MSGTRKTIYVPKNKKWIFRAIEQVRKEALEVGVNPTDSDILLDCITTQLEEYRNSPEPVKEIKEAPDRVKR